jgi:hypothetical protein
MMPLQAAHANAIASGDVRGVSLSLSGSGLEAGSCISQFFNDSHSDGVALGGANIESASCARVADEWLLNVGRIQTWANTSADTYSFWSQSGVWAAYLPGAPVGTDLSWALRFSSSYGLEITGYSSSRVLSFSEGSSVHGDVYLMGFYDECTPTSCNGDLDNIFRQHIFDDVYSHRLSWDSLSDSVGPEPISGEGDYLFSGMLTTTRDYRNFVLAVDTGLRAETRVVFAEVPEPGTLALLSLGLAAIGFSRRRQAA